MTFEHDERQDDDSKHEEWKELRENETITLANATLEDMVREIIFRGEGILFVLPVTGKVTTTYTHFPSEELQGFLEGYLKFEKDK